MGKEVEMMYRLNLSCTSGNGDIGGVEGILDGSQEFGGRVQEVGGVLRRRPLVCESANILITLFAGEEGSSKQEDYANPDDSAL